jgi:hypothetical protein
MPVVVTATRQVRVFHTHPNSQPTQQKADYHTLIISQLTITTPPGKSILCNIFYCQSLYPDTKRSSSMRVVPFLASSIVVPFSMLPLILDIMGLVLIVALSITLSIASSIILRFLAVSI